MDLLEASRTEIIGAIVSAILGYFIALLANRRLGFTEIGLLAIAGFFIVNWLFSPSTNTTTSAIDMPIQQNIQSSGQISGSGCICAGNCSGTSVSTNAQIPAASILEPAAGNRGTLYFYQISGPAATSGVVWTYLDTNGNPASRSCLDSQLQFFNYSQLTVFD